MVSAKSNNRKHFAAKPIDFLWLDNDGLDYSGLKTMQTMVIKQAVSW